MNIAVLHDAVPPGASADEQDVLVQVEAVRAALAELGHESAVVPCTLNLDAAAAALRERNPDLVFNLVESIGGQGRLIHLAPALLESLGVRFTGCPADAVYSTSNKLVAKRLLAAAGIATPAWFSATDLERGVPMSRVESGRYIVKSVWEHASRGLDEESVIEADTPAALLTALNGRANVLGGEGFCEAYIDGREFNLSLLGGRAGAVRPDVLPPAEIRFDGYELARPKVVGYRAKWNERSFEYTHTVREFEFEAADRPLLGELERLALACWNHFCLRGYARVDFRVDGAGQPSVLEVNTNPCLSPDAGFAAAVGRAGMTFSQAVARIVTDT